MPFERPGRRRSSPVPPRHPAGAPAFTLVELLTVITVIAILTTISVGAVRGILERSKITRARGELAALTTALEQFKRLYGDYPQTGGLAQAPATPNSTTAGPGVTTAQAKLFNCLTGVFGARDLTNRLNGPNLLELGRLSTNPTSLPNQFGIPVSNAPNPPTKPEINACLIDPWGRRYLYYYKNPRAPNGWQASGYVLYSAGAIVAANGNQTPPLNPTTGLLLATQTPEMADNLYATNP